jgi:hypothetical protein
MDRFYAQPNIGNMTLGEQGKGERPTLTCAQIHEIGVWAVEKALGSQSDELRPWADWLVADLPDNERRLANAA